VLLLGAAAVLAVPRDAPRRPAPAAGYDPRRIAVLYFDDYSRGGELGYLANGLTESLIDALGRVEALQVISRNGVKRYRDSPVRFDSLVADLRVGSVVEGSVERAGDSVRVTVRLTDANTQSRLDSRILTYPLDGVVAMEGALAEEVSGFLRRRLGREIDLRQARAETGSPAAWDRVLRASQAMDDARDLEKTAESGDPRDAASVDRLLARADSLLAEAERADPRWARPAVLRGWVQIRQGVRAGGAREAAFLQAARREADAVLAREPGNARALELRGTVALAMAVSATDSAAQARELGPAERDLRAAVAAEPSLASAWSTLSALLRVRGALAESDLAARRALAEDAYLDRAEDILHRLAISALIRGDYAEARSLCDRGRRRASADWRFLECRLMLLREDRAQPPDPAAARALARELERVDPPGRARAEGRGYSPAYRLALEAAVLARAGAHDSARAVLARARRETSGDPELRLSLLYDEAAARLLMGDSAVARRLLAEVLAYRPALRPFAERDPLFRGLVVPR
jgi:serine/threonine-protein kinase